MNFRNDFVVLGLLAGLISGCGDATRGTDQKLTFADLSDDDVVVTVNESPLTWRELKDHLDFELQIKYFQESVKKSDPADKNYTEYRPWRLRNELLSSLINARLFELACQGEKIRATTQRVEEQEKLFVNTYAGRLKLAPTASVERVAAALHVSDACVRRLFRQDANRQTYLEFHEPLCTNITESVLLAAKRRVREFNDRADASNRVQCARLESIKAEIAAGADFAAMGKKYSEVRPAEAEFLDSFFWTDFKPEEQKLRDWAFSAKPGDLLCPVDNRDGISLYKVVSRIEGAKNESVVARKRAKVKLVRITLRAYDKIPITDDAAMKRRMMDGYRRGAMRDALQKFHQSMRIHYPNGTNLWAKIPSSLYAPPKPIK